LTPARLCFQLPLKPSRLLRARRRIREYLQQHCSEKKLIDDVVLCIEEAATNAIRHSGSSEPIDIQVGFEGDDLIAKVRDKGCGFDVDAFDPEGRPDLFAIGGRGLFLIAALTDEMKLHRNGGVDVHMVYRAVARREAAVVESGLGDASALSRVIDRESSLHVMLEEIDEGFLALDWEYRIVHANRLALRLTDKPRDELLDGRPWGVLSIMAGEVPEQAYRDAMELGRPSYLEHCSAVTGDWWEVRVYPTAAGVSVYFREINERKQIEKELLFSRERLATTLDAITDGFYTLDREWRVTYCNDKAAAFLKQIGRDEVLGHNYLELDPGTVGTEFERNERAAMEQREFRSFEAYYPPLDAWFEERDYPSADGITVLFNDITRRKRAEEERQRLLEESQAQTEELQAQSEELQAQGEELQAQGEELRSVIDDLTERTDLAEALNEINRRVHATFASDAILQATLDEGVAALSVDAADLLMRQEPGWVVRHHSGIPVEDVGRHISDAEAPVATRAIARMEPLAISDVLADPAPQSDSVRTHGVRSILAVPLAARQSVVGCLLFHDRDVRTFSAAEIDFAQKLGATASLALENARLYEAQRRIATTLQENFIRPLPEIEGLELGRVAETAYAPELVGGDFSDVIAIDEHHVAILIGDVAGKGIGAAGLTGRVHSAVSAFALVDPSPDFILRKTNELLLSCGSHEGFVTAFLLVVDLRSGDGVYACAGHPNPAVASRSASRLLEVPFGLPLGMFAGEYGTEHVSLGREDCVVLYTDGVTEARRGAEFFGQDRLVDTVAELSGSHPRVVADRVGEAAMQFAGTLKDDLQILAFRLRGRCPRPHGHG
jgi:serine phosphatase RsbU (regulator of sigma subunit)/PAS domain-containing protein